MKIFRHISDRLPLDKTWMPEDFGFYGSPERPDVYFKDSYELRRMPNYMWLLRRRKKNGTRVEILVKAYYYILPEDYIFAEYLFLTRLNGGINGTKLQQTEQSGTGKRIS